MDPEQNIDDEKVVDTTEGVEDNNQEVDTKAEAEQDDPETGIAALRDQIKAFEERSKRDQDLIAQERRRAEEERRAREQAERQARQTYSEAAEVQKQALQSRYDSVVNALAAASSSLNNAQNSYKSALSDQDYDQAAKLAAEIGVYAARVQTLEDGKSEIEAQAKQPSREAARSEPSETERRDQFMASLPSRSASWVRTNYDRYWSDPSFQRAVAEGHHAALGAGHAQDSDDYFRIVEEKTGLRQKEATETKGGLVSKAGTSAPRRSPTPAAPTSGSSPAAQRSSSGNAVELTSEEREFCKIMDMDEAAYARQKKSLQEEGHIGVR